MIEIGEYSNVYKCPVCKTQLRCIERDGDFQYKYECDGHDHNAGIGVMIQRAEEDEHYDNTFGITTSNTRLCPISPPVVGCRMKESEQQ